MNQSVTNERSPSLPEAGETGHQRSCANTPPSAAFGWLESGAGVVSGDFRWIDVSEPLAVWLGQSREQLRGLPWLAAIGGAEPGWVEPLRLALESTEVFQELDLVGSGSKAEAHVRCAVTRTPGAFAVRFASVLPSARELGMEAWDNHLRGEGARRELFVRLLRAETQLENLTQRIPGVVFSQRADLTFHWVSPRVEQITGRAPREWMTQPNCFWQTVHEADADELQQQLRQCSQTGRPISTTFRVRHAVTGQVSYILEHRHPLVATNGLLLGYEGVWLDVTRQAIAEKRLSSAAWKETLAVITMGLAHDFSNIMAGILSLSESFLSQVETAHPFREGLGLIRQNSMQAHQLVQRIVRLHHGKTGTSQYCDLNDLLADVVDLVRKIVPRRIAVSVTPSQEALPLYVDTVEFRQVIFNLALNASEAMDGGGTLTFAASQHDQLPEMTVARGVIPRLPAICLSVEDSGCGIKARHLASIFDPFFTTKSVNKGSGLGLYNTRLFVEKHGGLVSVDSVEGQGARFRIWLPRADFTEAERVAPPQVTRRRSVLLVGPADGGLDEVAEFLRCHDYHVVTAVSAAEALEILASGNYQFGGVMALVEPDDSTAASLLAQVRTRHPAIKTVLHLRGCHEDSVNTALLQRADLVWPPDLPDSTILDLLDRTLPTPATETLPAL